MNNKLIDPDLTPEQKVKVNLLSEAQIEEIDKAIISAASNQWQKVAKIVGMTMNNLPSKVKGIPDLYYAQRVRKLVADGIFESQGDLSFMRYSEIRLKKE